MNAFNLDTTTVLNELNVDATRGLSNEQVAELKEKYAHFSNDDLKLIIDTHVEDQPARGAGASNAPGLNEGNGETDEEAERKARNEAVEKMFSDLNFKEE